MDGELDWLAAGLPTEGRNADRPRAGDVARRDAPTCRLDEPIGQVRARMQAAGWDACVVVNDERVVLGLLRAEELRRGQDEPIEQVMRPGPSTFRPHVPIEELAHHMIHHDLLSSPVTTPTAAWSGCSEGRTRPGSRWSRPGPSKPTTRQPNDRR